MFLNLDQAIESLNDDKMEEVALLLFYLYQMPSEIRSKLEKLQDVGGF